ncbi:MAG: 1,4-alpha-glucan branching enzyme [Solirubrobacteraceae bacterium]|nr:1,4-alpha-glucan branching enzyme [Solirubrobacteraceae bacterium]
MSPGRLALVLHSHMPYVEGFGTWPFGEEWLFEAMATSYLPLLEILTGPTGPGPAAGRGPITLSVTPVLADQLEAPGIAARFATFLRELRPASHRLDIEAAEDPAVAAELQRAAGDYAWAAEHHDALGPAGLLGALAPHAAWTSSATHAVLPLVATDAGVRLQLTTGIDAHRARTPRAWAGGFWLPECAHAPWLDALLEEAGVHATCVDLTDVLGRGSPEQLRPLATDAGPLLVPIDREVLELVWSAGGYPSHAAYRDYHRRSARDHHPWAVDGAVYDPARALAQARADAADFVARARARVAGGGLCVCALDTELLGHWWYEGPAWLAAVLEEAERQGLELVHLDDALADPGLDPAPARDLPATTWGTPRDLSTWDAPAVADLAWQARAAELRVVAAGPRAGPRAVRELLALQSSDWAFLVSRELAGPYPRERAAAHAAGLAAALAGDPADDPALRNLAPHASPAPLLVP